MPLAKTSTVLCSGIILGIDMQTCFALLISFIVSTEMGISSFLCIYLSFY